MLLGVLNIGSNAAQLQVFEVRPGAPPLPTNAVKEPTLLGDAFDSGGAIAPDGVDRVIEAVNRAMSAARRLSISLPLGAGRLTRSFLPDDPPSREQLAALRRSVTATLRGAGDRLLWEGVPDQVIGTSRTFEQLARLSGSPAQRKGPFVRRSVTVQDLEAWIPRLAGLRSRERAKLRGVSRSRSRQILAGAVVAKATMKALNVDRVDVCPWTLREGIVLHYLQAMHNESFDLPLRPLNGAGYPEDTLGQAG